MDIPVYVICVHKAYKKRGSRTVKHWSPHFTDVRRFTAIEPKDFELDDVASRRTRAILNGESERVQESDLHHSTQIACYLSHRALWKECVRLQQPIVIVEDDSRPADCLRRVEQAVQEAPEDAGAVLVQHSFFRFRSRAVAGSIVRKGIKVNGTGAYLLYPKGAEILLHHSLPVDMHVDFYMYMTAKATSTDPEPLTIYAVPGAGDQSAADSLLLHTFPLLYVQTERRLVLACIGGLISLALLITVIVLAIQIHRLRS